MNISPKKDAQHRLSPSKLVNKVLHPAGNNRKRVASEASIESGSAAKRVRAGKADNIIVIDSDDDDDGGSRSKRDGPSGGSASIVTSVEDLQWSKLTKLFRLTPKELE